MDHYTYNLYSTFLSDIYKITKSACHIVSTTPERLFNHRVNNAKKTISSYILYRIYEGCPIRATDFLGRRCKQHHRRVREHLESESPVYAAIDRAYEASGFRSSFRFSRRDRIWIPKVLAETWDETPASPEALGFGFFRLLITHGASRGDLVYSYFDGPRRLADKVKHEVRISGDCWEHESPDEGIIYNGSNTSFQRAIYQHEIRELKDKERLYRKCNNSKCVNPHHKIIKEQTT